MDPYVVGHYQLGVANDVFDGVGCPVLSSYHAILNQQRGAELLGHLAL
jgi:hypothetical protein